MNRGSSPYGFSGLSSLRTAVQTRRRMPEREFHNSSFPHTKGRRRGSCVVPSASITSKSHDNTINPHFPSLYSWLPPCAAPPASICRPTGLHLSPHGLPFAAPPASKCRPAGFHLQPRQLSFAAPPVAIWRPAISSQSQQNESPISQS